MGERRSRILAYVIENEREDVNELAAMFAVSKVTVRKDLDHLERIGLIRREHGFAVAMAPDDLHSRLAINHDLKVRIAAAAVALVPNGATVMIESGSCCALLAAEIATQRRGVTIITNSAFIANYIRELPGARVVLLGGDYQPESQVTVGPMVAQGAKNFHVDRLFIGIDGYTATGGFSGRDHLRASAVQAMAEQASEVVVLTESSKFARVGSAALLPTTAVKQIVTDTGLPKPIQSHLTELGLQVTKVPNN